MSLSSQSSAVDALVLTRFPITRLQTPNPATASPTETTPLKTYGTVSGTTLRR